MKKYQKYQKYYLILLSVFMLGSFFIINVEGQENEQIKVIVDVLNVRSGPGLDYSLVNKIYLGEQYPVISESGAWLQIKVKDSTGWVANWLVERLSNPTSSKSKTVESTVTNLNVRTGPSTSFSIIDQIQPKTKYPLIDEEGEWLKIQLSANKFGWVASWLVTVSNESPSNNTLNSDYVIINVDILNIRSGPAKSFPIIGNLKQDDKVEVISIEDGWYKIKYDNDFGWIASEYASEDVGNQPTVTILNPGTNLREGPSTSYKVVGIANVGEQFPIVSIAGDWYQIQLPDGNKAFVAGWIVAVKGMDNNIEKGIDQALKGKVIVVDAGHGGNDLGATGLHFKSIEKNLNLIVAVRLQKKLESAGATVIMTRTNDKKVYLQERVDVAIKNKADAFISIHHNTNGNININGTITYYYSKGDKALAEVIQLDLVKRNGLKNLDARFGNYYVLRENPRLAVLIELAFISNYQDELTARSERFQENSAEGIFQGILKYFKS